jgi:uncharacterized repeat protein (TIGR03803 family)
LFATATSLFLLALACFLPSTLAAQTDSASAPPTRGPLGLYAFTVPKTPLHRPNDRTHQAGAAQAVSNLDTETVLYSFCTQGVIYCTTDGDYPKAGLVEDTFGNLFGTTEGGGANVGGTVFRLTPSGSGYNYTELYSFCSQANCTDGDDPFAGVIEDTSGNLYGTTAGGGTNDVSSCGVDGLTGCGTVFELTPSASGYTEAVLYSFCSQGGANCTDGSIPGTSLIEDASGNFYGTTYAGGANGISACAASGYLAGCGTVFKLTPSASGYMESVLYSFCAQTNCNDGFWPRASLIEDASGNFYGTTLSGGANGAGTVFKLTPNGNGYTESVLYNFCSQGGTNCTDGGFPSAALVEDASGNFYGTTGGGGVSSSGTVFELTPSGNGYTESVLYSFCSQGGANCTDGKAPYAGLIEDASGNLYGTTLLGGAGDDGGTVFKLTPSASGYTESVLYSFCSQDGPDCTDGQYPYAGLIEDASGNLYGTTYQGGTSGVYGAVFKLTPSPPGIAVSFSPTSLTIQAGQSGTAMLTVTPENGFDSAVSFACSGLPNEANCSFSPLAVTPSGSQPSSTTLTITTAAPGGGAALRKPISSLRASYALLLPGGLALGFMSVMRCKQTRRRTRLLGLVGLLGLALGMVSCGSGSNSSGGNSGTPAGSYTVTVTASASGTAAASQTANLTVTITQ